tara:strand:+ start:315 stop:686 length:372 start_codon:yes stop_codon:yes gene_type:complete
MRSLQVNGPWLEKILSGEKTIETSGQPIVKAGERIGRVYLRNEHGIALGVAVIGEKFEYKSEHHFRSHQSLHRVPKGDEFYFGIRKRTWGFPILAVRRLKKPIQLKTPNDQRRLKPVLGREKS